MPLQASIGLKVLSLGRLQSAIEFLYSRMIAKSVHL